MAINISPDKLQEAARQGFLRLRRYRRARAMFIKEYVGQYYRTSRGRIGEEPINLIFNAIRAIVPQIIMRTPTNRVTTDNLEHADYAELLGLGIDSIERDIDIKKVYRSWIVDAMFAFGITKTGICSSGQCFSFQDVDIDPGQIYTETVDLDNFTFDPLATSFDTSTFLGDKSRVPRQELLDSDVFDHDLVAKLPKSISNTTDSGNTGPGSKVENLTKKHMAETVMQDMLDYVDVVQLWFKPADRIITMPDPFVMKSTKFLGNIEYAGPQDGPYDFLSLTQPVPNNPLPVAPVSIIYDLHKMANKMFIKNSDQGDRQKDVTLYNPANADEAQDFKDAFDGDMIASTDPKAIETLSTGGIRQENIAWTNQLQVWFNFMAGNPDQLAGISSEAETATQAEILEANAGVTINDVVDIVYDNASKISRKHAWYLHTDPLIRLPLIHRPTGAKDVQVFLTPEQRRGDFLEYTFKLVQKSMRKLDPNIRARRVIEFTTKILPQVSLAAQSMLQLGVPFNMQSYLTRLAEEMEIGDWIRTMFDDPEFQQRLQLQVLLGPQNQGKGSTAGVQQNGEFPGGPKITTPVQDRNSDRQAVAAKSQAARAF